MKIFSPLALCVLSSLPALVETVSAAEVLTPAEALLADGIEIYGKYASTIADLLDKKISADKATKRIKDYTAAIKDRYNSLSKEDKAAVDRLLKDTEVVKMMEQLAAASDELTMALQEVDYFNSPALKAACRDFKSLGK